MLGINSAEWRDVAKFKGTVINRYYRETNGTPMFTVDFGGGIGQHEVRVRYASLDHHVQWPYLQPRTLDFGQGPLNTTGSGRSAGAGPSTILNNTFGEEDDSHLDVD